MRPQKSVLIVEPSHVIYEGLRAVLSGSGDYNVLSPKYDATLLEERLHSVRPDVLIINPTLLSATPKMQLAAIGRQRPEMPIVALVYQYVEAATLDAFKYHIDIRMGGSAIVTLIGESLAGSADNAESLDTSENYELSDRETDVLVLVAKGLSSRDIAERLSISIHTVNSHRKNITHKTGIKSVAGLAVYAMIHNLMD